MPFQNAIKWNHKPGARSHNLNGVPVSGARLASREPDDRPTKPQLGLWYWESSPCSELVLAKFVALVYTRTDRQGSFVASIRVELQLDVSRCNCYVCLPTSKHHQTSPSIVVPDIFRFIRCPFPVAQLPWHLARLGVGHGPCGRCRESDAQGVRQHGKTLEHAMGWCPRLYGDRYDRVCHGLLSNWQESSAESVIEWRRRVMIVQKCPEHVRNCLQITA